MITKGVFPESLRADLAVSFEDGRQAMVAQEWRQLIEVVPTTSSAKTEIFYGDKTELRRFRGERQPSVFFEYKSVITLDDWEMTETIKRQVLDDDQSGGVLRRKIGEFGQAVEVSMQRKTEEHLRRGTSYKSFDTNQFFGRNHVYTDSKGATHGTLWTNFETGGSQVDAITIQLEQLHFAQLKTDRDHVLGMKLTDIAVKRGTDNAKTAREIANSQFTVEVDTIKGSNTTNVFQGTFGIMEQDYGIGDSEWYGFDLSNGSMKPIKVLSHSVSPGWENLKFTQLLDDSDTGFWRNEFAFGVFGRFDWNPGDPRSARLHGITVFPDPDLEDFERHRELQPNEF